MSGAPLEELRYCSWFRRDKIRNEFANWRSGVVAVAFYVRLQLSTEQTIGPVLAEKPELAANPGQTSQASHFGEREANR